MLIAKTRIRMDGVRYSPGQPLPKISRDKQARLLKLGAVDKLPDAEPELPKKEGAKPAKAEEPAGTPAGGEQDTPEGIDPNLIPPEEK